MSKKSSENSSTNICLHNTTQLSFLKEKCDTVHGNSNKNMKKSSKSSEKSSIIKTLIKNVFFEELKTKMLIFGDDFIILYEYENI